MLIDLDRKGTVDALRRLLAKADNDENITGILILTCEGNEFKPETVNMIFQQCNKPLFGGVFTGIIFNKERLSKGTIVAGIRQPIRTAIIKNISNVSNLGAVLEQNFDWESLNNKTVFVFVDGLSHRISELIECMFNCYGLIPNYIGGGAGSLLKKIPCVISSHGLLEDAAIFALADIRSGIGVAHGWKPIAGPIKVTEADRHTIISLNWRPAFEVYKETVEEVSGKLFDETNFAQLAREHPFGIVKMAEEMIVRDPIAVDGDTLVCVGEVSVGSLIYILKGDKDSLISGAVKARQSAEASYWQKAGGRREKPFTTFFIDCISRVLFLQSDFERELSAVHMGYPLLGALTLGEIANTGESYLEFYNKTSVVGLLGD